MALSEETFGWFKSVRFQILGLFLKPIETSTVMDLNPRSWEYTMSTALNMGYFVS